MLNIAPAPIRRTLRVKAPQERAFDIFAPAWGAGGSRVIRFGDRAAEIRGGYESGMDGGWGELLAVYQRTAEAG